MADIGIRRITWRNADIARVFVLGLVFVFLWRFFWMVYSALFLGLLAVLIAIILHAPARLISRWIPFRLGLILTVTLFLAAFGFFLLQLIPQILEQIPLLASQLPSAFEQAMEWVRRQTGGGEDDQVVREIQEQLADFIGRFVPLAFNLIALIAGSFAILFLAVFLAAQPDQYRDLLIRLVPPTGRANARRIYDEAGRSLRNWVIGKAFTMVMVGIFTWVGLTLLGVPGALVLAALAALLEFIPTFGPIIAAAPAVIAAFLVSPATALYVAIYYFVLQQVQSAVTIPLIERRAVDIPPAALLIWQLMLAVGFGIIGLFIATPLLAVIVVTVRILYVEPSEERYASDRREAHNRESTSEAAQVPPKGSAKPQLIAAPEVQDASSSEGQDRVDRQVR